MAAHDMSRPGNAPQGRSGAAQSGHSGSGKERAGATREDAEALLGARQELGSEYEPALVDAFLDRVDHAIDARVQARVEAQTTRKPRGPAGSTVVPVFSLIFAIPLSAIAGGTTGLPGLILAWAGIVLVNLAYALRRGH